MMKRRKTEIGILTQEVSSLKKEDLFLSIGFDWSGRSFDDDRDLYLYKFIVNPNKWDSNQSIRLMYDIEKDRFCCQKIDTNSMASRNYDDETMLKHIHDVLESIAKERGI
ncbi:MAG: hypothetical protein J5507_02675 [Clostridia bacterium]|nr:hypothetical protein [Clostridia bacterium]